MHAYNVLLTWEAIYDIVDITEYIEMSFGCDRADRFQSDIQAEMEKLEFLGTGFPKTQIFYRNYAIHKKAFPPSIIFYVLVEESKEIHILRVLREEQDWMWLLEHDQNYTYPERN